jgi:hypothetical protein
VMWWMTIRHRYISRRTNIYHIYIYIYIFTIIYIYMYMYISTKYIHSPNRPLLLRCRRFPKHWLLTENRHCRPHDTF